MSKKTSSNGPKKQKERRRIIVSVMAGFLVLVMLLPMISMILSYL